MNVLNDLINSLTNEITNKLDDKLKEACEVWGVDINNHKEVSERCEIRYIEYEDKREVRIDGILVMMFTDIIPRPLSFDEPYKMAAEFKCSEILKPEDIGL